jgi:adenine-specific DNA-methyltransferase
MTVSEIRQILESPYDRKVWKGFLKTQFTNNKLNVEDRTISLSDKTFSKNCLSLGNYEINQYTKIGIFEVELNEKVNIARNRVALRNLIKDLTKQVAGAMVVFVQGDKWRFSYISKRKIRNQNTNEIQDKETAPKRYTYLFGKGEKALTAAQRFDRLIEKQKANLFDLLSLDDFEDAFSVEKLSKEFFANYKNAYEDFVQFLTGKRYAKKGSKYVEQVISEPNWQLTALFGKDEKQARDFVKRMMGRIVFLYFIQKKGWLSVKQSKKWGEGNPEYLFDLFKKSKQKDDFYARELVPLFFTRLNNEDSENTARDERFPYLNGGLFDDTQDRKYNKLHLPEDVFERMFNTFNNYNFTIYEDAPDEHTVAVDPEMLGHIFENLLEDNKDKGAFYTPKEIVHYMCKESLKAYLFSQDEKQYSDDLAKTTIDKIIQQQELNNDETTFAEKNAYKIIDALESVKICDPAIGSGAFPMGLLQEIFNAQIYLQELKGFKKAKTDADIKKHIIEESIYGVDIDAGAVDIARLRFWLSLVVDEQEPQPLPNLDFKIICANTLIPLGQVNSLDMDSKASLAVKELEKIRHDFFNVSSESKLNLERQFKKVQTDLLSLRDLTTKDNYEFYTKLYGFNPFDFVAAPCSWFDPWWMFGVKDGFDIVIGNPPYIKEPTNKSAFDGFRKTKYYQGKMDLWYGFACVMLDNLKKETGILTFIATNNWVTNTGASKFRNKVAEDAQILQLIDFGNYKIFESADIQTMIMLFKSNNQLLEYPFEYRRIVDTEVDLDDIVQIFNGSDSHKIQILNPLFNRQALKDKSFLFSEGGLESILTQIKISSNFTLDGKLEIAQGIVPNPDVVSKNSLFKITNNKIENYDIKVGDGVFVIENDQASNFPQNEQSIIKPLWEPYEIERFYVPNKHQKSIIYFTKKILSKDYPSIISHLEKFREIMDERRENQQGKLKFYQLHWPRDDYFFEKGPKILGVRKCQKPTFAYTEEEAYVMMAMNVIKCNQVNAKYLTALLNSKVIAFWLKHKGKMQGFHYQVDKEPLVDLPLIKTDQDQIFASLVDYILFLKANSEIKANEYVTNDHIIQSFEEVINACVYELYFADHMKEKEIDVLRFARELIKPISNKDKTKDRAEIINSVYTKLKEPSNEIRSRMLLFATRSENTLLQIQKIY